MQVAVLFGQAGGHLDQLIGAVGQSHHQRGDAPGDGQLTLHLLVHDAGNDGLCGAVLAQQAGGVARLGHRDDGGSVDVLGGQAGSVRGCVADADLAVAGIHQTVVAVVHLVLGALGNGGHGLEGLHGVSACSGLTGKHDGRGAVVDGVCHVRDLGTGGPGVDHHAVQHLGSRDNGFAKGERAVDDALLDAGQLGEVDLNAQVATGDHDGVGGGQDAVDVVHALAVLDLGDDADVGVVLVQQVADVVHVLCGAHKGSGDEIKALLHAEDDVVAVTLAQVRHGEVDAGHVDALFVFDLAAVQHLAGDVGVGHVGDAQLDEAVVQHDGAALVHILGQVLVGDGADLLGALHLTGGQGKGLACFQHLHAVLELFQADLGALGVQQSSHGFAQLGTDGFQVVQAALVLLIGAVGKVETGHVHAVGDQLAQHAVLIGGRAQGADDLCFSHIKYLQLRLFKFHSITQRKLHPPAASGRAKLPGKTLDGLFVQNPTTLYYKHLDTIEQEKYLLRNP